MLLKLTDADYKALANALPHNVPYASTTIRRVTDEFIFSLTISMIVYKSGRPVPVWYDYDFEDKSPLHVYDDVDFDINKFFDAYEGVL